jgi:cell division protein FtsQ
VVVGVVSVAVVGAGGWAATGSPLLDLDAVMVDGVVHTPAPVAAAATGLRPGAPMVDLDLAAAVRGVEALPWVQRATVERHWPGQVRVHVVERAPAAALAADGGETVLVDATGRVLERVDPAPSGLAVLSGLPPAGPPGSRLSGEAMAAVAVATVLPAELRARTAVISPGSAGSGEVELHLTPDGTVRLGRPEDLDRKFDAIRAVLAQVDLRNLAVLDVRRPDSPILTRRDTATKVSTPRAG